MTERPAPAPRDTLATPPALAVRLVALRLPAADAEFALGDLEEDFHDVAAARGIAAARRWYWAQTARVLLGRQPATRASSPGGLEPQPRRPLREHMTDTLRDIRMALRAFTRHPILTIAAVLTLALGIGANAAVFSVARPVLASPLPLPDENRLAIVMLSVPQDEGPARENPLSPGDFLDIGKSTSFRQMAAYTRTAAEWNLTGTGDPVQVRVAGVTRGFFDVMGVTPLAGRPLNADDEARGVLSVAINERLWRGRFGADPAIVGRAIVLNGAGFTVVGVMPDAATLGTVDADIWRAQPIDEATAYQMQSYFLVMVGRLRDGVALEDANVELAGLMRRVNEERGRDNGLSAKADSLRERLTGPVRPSLLLLVGGAVLVLLIAAVNLTGLQLSRNLARRQELVVRRALGAARSRIVRQLTTEGLVLALVGGAVGLVIASMTLRGLSRLAPPVAWYEVTAELSTPVIVFTTAIAVVTGLVIGAWSALSASGGSDAVPVGARGGTASRTAVRARSAVLAGQVAMTVVLLVSATLTSISLLKVLEVDRGFTLDRALIADVQLPPGGITSGRIQFFDSLVEQTAALPGATGSCAISEMPLDTPGGWYTFVPEGDRPADFKAPQAATIGITSDCFHVLGIPILRGRSFTSSESEGVAIVSESAARDIWPENTEVLDRIVHLGTATGMPLRVVGVAPDIRVGSLETLERGQVWLSASRGFPAPERLIVATEVPPASLAGQVRDVLKGLAPGLALANVRTMDEVIANATAARRFVLVLLGSFAAIALLLCAVGIYGVLSHQVGQRTREIGIRLALGAGKVDVMRVVSRQVLGGVAMGLVGGLAASWALSSALATLMFEMSATDPRVYAGVAVFAAVIACVAALPPLGRAVSIQPLAALRAG